MTLINTIDNDTEVIFGGNMYYCTDFTLFAERFHQCVHTLYDNSVLQSLTRANINNQHVHTITADMHSFDKNHKHYSEWVVFNRNSYYIYCPRHMSLIYESGV